MYHGIIQHRIYLTTYLRNQIKERGLDAPVGLGRIWRVVADSQGKRARPGLAKASSRKLVEALGHAEGWWRDTAQRLLVERHDLTVKPALERLARTAPTKVARLHALWTLEGLDAVEWPVVEAALADVDVDVAAAAARLGERYFAQDAPRVVRAIATRAEAGEPAFLRQAALSLGAGPAQAVDGLLAQLALRHGALPFMADALVSSWSGRESAALAMLSSDRASGAAGADSAPGAGVVAASLAAAILQSNDAAQIDALFARLASGTPAPWLVDAILDGVDRFIPGEGGRRRAAFLPEEPKALAAFARTGGARGARAAEDLEYLRWRGRKIDEDTILASLTETERKRFARGREEFKVCAACHQPEGQGLAGLAPPLVGSPWANGSKGAAIRIVLQGKTDGEMTMPPLAALDDEQIAAILTFVRRSWGNEASAVTAGEVHAVRSETRLREEPLSEADLAPFH
jgi:mono/diheme cytochrome c family protein